MKRACAVAIVLFATTHSVWGATTFRYADSVTTTGGQFSSSYPPSNLMNNAFTSAQNVIDTTVDYLAAGNNYATVSGKTSNFDLVFAFKQPTKVDGMYVWNYVYRNGSAGATSTSSGVKSYTLTFFSGSGATGSVIGNVVSGTLSAARYNARNVAQTIKFATTYANVRSVVMHIVSNYGSTAFTGMNELAFSAEAPDILSFTSSVPFAQRPATPTLSWAVTGSITSLQITPNIGDVRALTRNGVGSTSISPLGEQTYTLVLNGAVQKSVSVVGLPMKSKVFLYLLIGQSNMQGAGSPYSATLDAPHPRVVKFGSRNGLEPIFVKGGHPLTMLESVAGPIGMGVEFGKTTIAAQSDPEIVVVLINHAMGSSAIQWWAPGVVDNKQVNPLTGLNYRLYDEAVARVNAASNYGVLKGVLWHQGEYNAADQTDPLSDPDGYSARLQDLVRNLRASFSNPNLPFVCGKFVPASWVDGSGGTVTFSGLPHRSTVEAALMSLPTQVPSTACINNDGLRGNADNLIHFDAYSQRLLGQRYAAAMMSLQAP